MSVQNLIDKPIVKSVLGFLGIFGVALTAYFGFFQKPSYEYELVSATDFLKKNKSNSRIRVLVDSTDIRVGQQNVTSYVIKVQNNGPLSIRNGDYDDDVFGLQVKDATLLGATLLNGSFSPENPESKREDCPFGGGVIIIPKRTMNKGDYFFIEVLAIHSDFTPVRFYPVGKIAGQKVIPFKDSIDQSLSLMRQALIGGIEVQLIRAAFYAIVVIILYFLLLSFSIRIFSWYYKKRRENFSMKKLLSTTGDKVVIADFVARGASYIEFIHNIYKHPESDVYKTYQSNSVFSATEEDSFFRHRNTIGLSSMPQFVNEIDRLIERGYLHLDPHVSLSFDEGKKESVEKTYALLIEYSPKEDSFFYPWTKLLCRYDNLI